jgi:nitrate reductase molybdenum cofactor assembly chaperone NarJ/NarW
MNTSKPQILQAASFLLSYPDDDFMENLAEAKEWVEQLPLSRAKGPILKGIEQLSSMKLTELQQLYVSLFDLRESTCLYLTAHELGDSNRRGNSLLELRQLLFKAGVQEETQELPDYLPLLFELLAMKEGEMDLSQLEKRVSTVIMRIKNKLDNEGPYFHLFAALEQILPKADETDIARQDAEKKPADLEEMPYPLYYEH